MMWRFLLCSFVVLSISLTSLADTLEVAGHARTLTAPLIVNDGEVLAPFVSSLPHLGLKAFTRGPLISLVQPDGAICRLTIGAKTAKLGTKPITLALAPRKVRTEIYLPAMALATVLPFTASYNARTKALSLLPLLRVTCEPRVGGLVILLRGALPLHYTRGVLSNPPRVFFDFTGVSLGKKELTIPINAGNIKQLRLKQQGTPSTSIRVVADLVKSTPLQIESGEHGRLLTIWTGKKAVPPQKAKLLAASIRSLTGKQSELTVTTSGPAQVTSAYHKRTRLLTLTFSHGSNGIAARQLRALKDAHIKKVAANNLPGGKVTLAITLTQDLEYSIEQQAQRVLVRVSPYTLQGMIIVLDAGHGGNGSEGPASGPGAPGRKGIMMEREVNLDVVQRLARLLKPSGATIVLTRSDARYVSLNARVAVANARRADLFISVHCNSVVEPAACGTETYYYTSCSAALARAIHPALIAALGLHDRKIRNDMKYQVITFTHMPAVLVELAFISNEREEALLVTPPFRQKAAEGLAAGIRSYAARCNWRALRSCPNSLRDGEE